MRLIDGDKLLEVIAEQERWNVPDFVYESIKNAPIIEAEPTRHGRWIVDAEDWKHQIEWFRCSLCDYPTPTAFKYCPKCGAKMDEDEISNIAKESADKISKALEKVRVKGMQKQNIKEDDEP